MDAFDETSSAMTRMLDGGGKPLEMIQVAISFFQSFSLVALIEMEWPTWFRGFKMFTLDLAFMNDAGDWPTILIGLLTAPILILQLDHGLFVRRNDHDMVQKTVSDEEMWKKRRNFLTTVCLVSVVWITGFVLFRGFTFSGYIGGFVFSLCFIIFVWNLQSGWILPVIEGTRDNLDKITLRWAFVLTIFLFTIGSVTKRKSSRATRMACVDDPTMCADLKSRTRVVDVFSVGFVFFLLVLTCVQLLHWVYLRSLLKTCKTTNQNFKMTRCSHEFTVFLFLYLIAYLSGVNASLTMAIMEPYEVVNGTADCNAIEHEACGLKREFILTTDECNEKPIYRSPLVVHETGHAEFYMAEFSELVYFPNPDARGYFVTHEHILPVDKETLLPAKFGLSSCGKPGRSQEVKANGGAESRITGSGCDGCSELETSTDWMCLYLESGRPYPSKVTKVPGNVECFSWEASHTHDICEGRCVATSNALGWILFLFYGILPLVRLGNVGHSVKKLLKQEKEDYGEGAFEAIAIRARSESTHTDFEDVKDSTRKSIMESDDKFGFRYRLRHLPSPIKFWDNSHEVIRKDLSQQVAVIASLLSAFEEKWWWWKIYLLAERSLLAAVVFTEVSVWAAFAVTAFGWSASYYTSPYWEDEEDKADLIARGTTLVTVFFACLAETEVIRGNEIFVAIILNLCAACTLVLLIMAIGPRRVVYSVIAYYRVKKRQYKLQSTEEAADAMTEKEVEDMTEAEFLSKSIVVRSRLMKRFQDHLVGQQFLEWVQAENTNVIADIIDGQRKVLEKVAKEFNKSMCWLYSPADGTMLGVTLKNKEVTEISWRGEGLFLKEGMSMPKGLKNLNTCKKIDLSCNNIYLDIKANKKDFMNLDKKFIIMKKQDKVTLESVALKLGKKLEWLYNGHGAHDVENWRGIEFTKDNKIVGISWAGQGLKGELPEEICELKDLKRLDLRFNDITVENNDTINNMQDCTMPEHWRDDRYVRLRIEEPNVSKGLHFFKPLGDGKHGTRKNEPCLGHRPRLIHLAPVENGGKLVHFEDSERPGYFLIKEKDDYTNDFSMGSSIFSDKQMKSKTNFSALSWKKDPDQSTLDRLGTFEIVPALSGTQGNVSFMWHRKEGGLLEGLTQDNLDRYLTYAKGGRSMGVRVASTLVKSGGRSKGLDFSGPVLWPKDFSFKMLTFKDDMNGKEPPSGNTKTELAHGWKNGLVNWKVSDMINRMEDDSSFKMDRNKDKIALCEMARRFGKDVNWLLNGMGGYKVDWWRGIFAEDGKVVGIDWRHESLRGKVPDDLLHFKNTLQEITFLDNSDLSKTLSPGLLELQKKLGRKCEFFDPRDDMNVFELFLDSIWRLPWFDREGWNKLGTFFVAIFTLWIIVSSTPVAWPLELNLLIMILVHLVLVLVAHFNFKKHSKEVQDGKDHNKWFKEVDEV